MYQGFKRYNLSVLRGGTYLADRLRVLRNYGGRVKYVNEVQAINSQIDSLQTLILRVKLKVCKPAGIIVVTESEQTQALMRELYKPFNRSYDRTLFMDVRSAELTKYAVNAMRVTKISFMNEIANLAERLGADVEQVRKGIGADPRIGCQFTYPGCGFNCGGSCFPKDVHALARVAQQIGNDAQLLTAVEAVNNRQKGTLFDKLAKHLGDAEQLQGKNIETRMHNNVIVDGRNLYQPKKLHADGRVYVSVGRSAT